MNARQRVVRHHPALQKLLSALPHYAIWDDHDYGPNDSNRSFVFKDASLVLFQRYWANPSYGLPGGPGIFTQFSVADADFFLLDDRGYRDHDRATDFPGKQLYGSEQLIWLENALLASRARFKLIVGGSQFLNDRSKAEGWQHFPAERDAFLDWLGNNHINGVIFLSGDLHHTELLKRGAARRLSPVRANLLPAHVAAAQGRRGRSSTARGRHAGRAAQFLHPGVQRQAQGSLFAPAFVRLSRNTVVGGQRSGGGTENR